MAIHPRSTSKTTHPSKSPGQILPRLERRYDKGITPYNLRSCAYHEEFAKEKLFWMDLTEQGRFVYSESEMFCINIAFMVSGYSIKFLCAVLNSSLITWFVKNIALTSGMGLTRWIPSTVERIPIPKINADERRPFVRLVDEILDAKSANPDADTWRIETELDDLVYDLYGLAEDERTAIERSLGLIHATDEVEDAAIVEWIRESGTDEYVSRESVMEILRNPQYGG